VFVVNDDASVRELLESLVRGAGLQVQTFSDARTFLSHPRAPGPNCVILGVNLPDIGGLDLQTFLLDRHEMPVIFFTDCADVRTTVRAMKAGAVEFLTKPLDEELLLNAIRHAILRSSAAIAQEDRMRVLHDRYALLSRREREVMTLVIAGKLNKLIADELGISEITVKAHRGKVMRKMQAASVPDLVNMATRLGVGASSAMGEQMGRGVLGQRARCAAGSVLNPIELIIGCIEQVPENLSTSGSMHSSRGILNETDESRPVLSSKPSF
jgi:FixJ family two-component response regulator